jgi:hypothetical protein
MKDPLEDVSVNCPFWKAERWTNLITTELELENVLPMFILMLFFGSNSLIV